MNFLKFVCIITILNNQIIFASSTKSEVDGQAPDQTMEHPESVVPENNYKNLSESDEDINTKISSLSLNPDDVQFFLYYDPKNLNASVRLKLNDTKGLRKAKFRQGAQVIFLTHGFMSGYNISDSLGPIVKNAYLSQNIVNIIAVDWQRLSTADFPESFLSYYAVIKRTPIVGTRLADFIIFLTQQGKISGPEDVHLVGHSLGAHVSGIAGNLLLNRTGKLVDRITGLDPAGPLYNMAKDELRLDASDANFVDILHTAIGTLGSGDIHGHVDFFANGGRGISQTGCLNFTLGNLGPFFSSGLTGVCSHSSAYYHYARSILRTKPELFGCRCDHRNYFVFPNQCVIQDRIFCEDRTLFGEYVPRTAKGNFFVDISGITNRKLNAQIEQLKYQ